MVEQPLANNLIRRPVFAVRLAECQRVLRQFTLLQRDIADVDPLLRQRGERLPKRELGVLLLGRQVG